MKSLTPPARLALADAIHPTHQRQRKAKPVRRVWIPKPGKSEKRPLGIPVMFDRAWQASPSKPWNQSGKPASKPPVTDSDRDAASTMPSEPFSLKSATKPSMCWMRTSKVASIIWHIKRS